MSRSKLMRVALGAAALSVLPAAHAVINNPDTAALSVTASIAAQCKLTLSSGGLAFGGLDPTSSSPATASATASYQCTKGTVVSATGFTVGSSSSGTYNSGTTNAMTASGTTDTIPFKITWTQPAAFTGAGFGSATAQSVPLSGEIANTDFVTKTPASYSANVTISVAY